jgi:hypothetical protein
MAGLALVMGFALLCVRQISAGAILLAVQSGAVAVAALVAHLPLMAIPPILLAAGVWFTPDVLATLEARTVPVGGAKLGVAAAAVLAVLCQSQSTGALPLAVILVAVLLAATRRHPLMHVMALVGLQNGIVLASAQPGVLLPEVVLPRVLLSGACFALPLPLAVGILAAHLRSGKTAAWLGWVDFGMALVIFVATILVPLDSIGSIFAPLLGLEGALRAWRRRNRQALPARRGLALLTGLFQVLAVSVPDVTMSWLAVLACIATSLLPVMTRRWDDAVLAVLGAGIALFGLTALGPSILGYFSMFAGFIAIAAVVPDLAPILVVLILRLANQAPWSAGIEAIGLTVALLALLACAALLLRRSSAALLQQSQACVAALSICLGQADGRFAGLVLLILLILCRSAARIADQPIAGLAIAGLGGVPPLGVFPALVLVVLAISGHRAWLLLPLGAAFVPILLASLPRRLPGVSPSVGWVPLALAVLTGYFAPEGLVHWWHVLTAGRG